MAAARAFAESVFPSRLSLRFTLVNVLSVVSTLESATICQASPSHPPVSHTPRHSPPVPIHIEC
jgi:hypothetical protein